MTSFPLNCYKIDSGGTIVSRLAKVQLWNASMGETATKIHLGTWITDHCPHKEMLLGKIRAKAGIEVAEGTHPYKPENIFA